MSAWRLGSTSVLREIGSGGAGADFAVVRLTPERWAWWDVGAAFQGVLDTPGYLLPLSQS